MKRGNRVQQFDWVAAAASYIFLFLLGYVPLHIFLSTYLGTTFGMLTFAKIAKDIVLVVGFIVALVAAYKHWWFKEFFRNRLVALILVYGALTLVMAFVRPTDTDAEVLGVVYNTRFFLFLLYGMLLARLLPAEQIKAQAIKTVLVVGGIVVLFGIVQYLWLPDDALRYFGYTRANGVLPAFFIDDKPDLERVMSTLRDPNSLGSYLIIIAMLLLATQPLIKNKRLHLPSSIFYLLTLACLFFTFSRSAWLGFVLALGFLAAVLGGRRIRALFIGRIKMVGAVLAVLVLISGVTLYSFRSSYFVQNVVFHADESTALEDPNQKRLRFWQESAESIAKEPFGSGPGTAGLASIRNDQGGELNENYYLQIGSEVGVIGLALFLVILFLTGRGLYRQLSSTNVVAAALLASFAGLLLTNFLVHIWSNEAAAFTWWGLAGLWLSRASGP